jgi:hypothetical protein
MLRCAASFVVAAYALVRLTPQDLRALPAELFTKPSLLMTGELCINDEKWFASGESNIFRLSRDYVSGLS